jgi:hypothetical protein
LSPSSPAVATAPAAPERIAKAPPAAVAVRAEHPPASGRALGFKIDDGSSATFDRENGRVRLHTPFGNLELSM